MQHYVLVQMTPGVHHAFAGDGEDQRYVTPGQAVRDRGAGGPGSCLLALQGVSMDSIQGEVQC